MEPLLSFDSIEADVAVVPFLPSCSFLLRRSIPDYRRSGGRRPSEAAEVPLINMSRTCQPAET